MNVPNLHLSKPVICIVGPTSSGKTELSQSIAQIFNGAVISADSMQIYRGMDIGTGKILPHERKVAHFGLDIVNPGEAYSAQLFQAFARKTFTEIDADGLRCILCGGTGFYVRAAVDDYCFPQGEQVDNPIREFYKTFLEEHGQEELWNVLKKRDPSSAEVIHPNNTRRVIRALELYEEGESYAQQKENLSHIPPYVHACFVGLDIDPDILRKRIDARVDAMINQGLVDEVRSLLHKGFRVGLTAQQAIGYKEIVAMLDGDISLEEAVCQIKTATHRYAKRQRSWFRHEKRVNWISANEGITPEVILEAQNIIQNFDEAL